MAIKNYNAQEKDELLSIVDNIISYDDVDNMKQVLFDLQNMFLQHTASQSFNEQYMNNITGTFSLLYNTLGDLKKFQ